MIPQMNMLSIAGKKYIPRIFPLPAFVSLPLSHRPVFALSVIKFRHDSDKNILSVLCR